MSKHTRQFIEQVKSGEQVSFLDSIKQAASALKEVGGQIWDAGKPMFDHGRAEAANLLFSGQAHVMYMKGQKDIEQGQGQEQSNEMTQDQRDLGREM